VREAEVDLSCYGQYASLEGWWSVVLPESISLACPRC
jgi:hypothetical protein